jgi:hypothetical protein
MILMVRRFCGEKAKHFPSPSGAVWSSMQTVAIGCSAGSLLKDL